MFISGQISLSIWQNSWVLKRVGQTTALHLTYAYQEDQSRVKVLLKTDIVIRRDSLTKSLEQSLGV